MQDSGAASPTQQRPRSAFERASMDIECASQDIGSAGSEQHAASPAPPGRQVPEPTSAACGAVCRTDSGVQCAAAGASAATQPCERWATSQPHQPQGAGGAAWDAGWPGGAQDDSADLDAEMALLMDAAAAGNPRPAPRLSGGAEAGPSGGLPRVQARAALQAVARPPAAAIAGGTVPLPGAKGPPVRRRAAGWRLTARARWRACATPCWRRRTRAVRGCCACCTRPTAARSSRTCAMAGPTHLRARATLCTSLLQWTLLAARATLSATAAQARQGLLFLFLTGRAGSRRCACHCYVVGLTGVANCVTCPPASGMSVGTTALHVSSGDKVSHQHLLAFHSTTWQLTTPESWFVDQVPIPVII